jgi:hypothetical protein
MGHLLFYFAEEEHVGGRTSLVVEIRGHKKSRGTLGRPKNSLEFDAESIWMLPDFQCT